MMTITRLHSYAWLLALLTALFLVELSGALRIGATAFYGSLMLILLVGFFGVRWFAGILALWLVLLSFLVAPFWVLDVGGVALGALALLLAAPYLTGHRVVDFLILLGVGVVIASVATALARGGAFPWTALGITLLENLIIGALAFRTVEAFTRITQPS